MKKRALALFIVGLLLLVGGVGWWWLRQYKKSPLVSKPTVSNTTYKKACDIFTLSDAVAVLGQGTTQTPSHTDNITAQKAVTTCLYSYDPGSFSDLVSASILLQGSDAAAAKASFANAKPANAQDVGGYGDATFWDPNLGQLNILKGQYWIIVAAGSGPLSQRDQDLPRKIADSIMKQI